MTTPIEGQCRCGRIRMTLSGPPLITMACHCTGCQQMSGSAFSVSALVPQDAFAVTSGDPVIGGTHGETRHYFCGWCMSWLYTRPHGLDDLVNLRATLFGHLADSPPFLETWTSERRAWAQTGATRSFPGLPDPATFPALMQAYRESQAARPDPAPARE